MSTKLGREELLLKDFALSRSLLYRNVLGDGTCLSDTDVKIANGTIG